MECKNIWKVEWKRVNIACIHQAQMHSPCMKDQHRKAISTYCHKRHLLGQFFIQYWPLLVPMGSKDYRNPALIIFRATLTRSLELKEQHCSAKKELTKVTLAKIQLLLDYSTSTSTTYQFLGNFKVLVETFVEVMGCSHDIADSAPTEYCTTFHCSCVRSSQA